MLRREEVRAWWDAHPGPAVLVEVIEARGSVPRGVGTRMVVGASDSLGTIGGGHLEWKAIEQARGLIGEGVSSGPQTAHYPLGPALGQCCGGAVTLGFERLAVSHLDAWPEPPPLFHLLLFGAGHVGRAVERVLATLDVSVLWIDEREGEFPPPGPGGVRARITRLCCDMVEAEVARAPAGAFYLVLTHQHELDFRIARAILARGDAGFFGLIGSRSKSQRFLRRLAERGLSAEALDRMTCPIGLPGIDGKSPEVIAVSVVAQLLQAAQARDTSRR